jgi:hypothetical protein
VSKKKYIVERHHMGFTTQVSEPLDKWDAIALIDELEDEAPSGVSFSKKAVRNG